MDSVTVKLTVYFDDPFWIGVVERFQGDRLAVAKVTFGAEPKDYEVRDYVLKSYHRLRFSPAVAAVVRERADNPKRRQREARRQLTDSGIGTKSQQALKLQQEQVKTERRAVSREQREVEKQRQFELKQQKRKEKHRGR